ncbi:DUF1501 domain-containing protein [Gimibacter soli]|uniref:DUF1501 domain-containing protein n=1 Tax=Gimibacter soli TaxID=3024400 RepID=A0AAF0BKN6_9PROT|nr:DUF1501 domain-containing protein [Gimibacter soli]WCL53162.1 DUF1501 domain-containing protein [Gimibacter soli]
MREDALLNRRRFLALTGATAALTLFSPHLMANEPGEAPRFVFLLLRGGMDGLSAVPMLADPAFAGLRGVLAEEETAGLPLDGGFALHPKLATLHALYGAKEATIFHAVAGPYRSRSHFDAQDMLEQGIAAPATSDGFLARMINNDGATKAVALAETMPLALRGGERATSWAPTLIPEASPDILDRLDDLYAGDALLEAALQQMLENEAVGSGMGGKMNGGRGNIVTLAESAARFLTVEGGPNVAMLEFGGWDTHTGQTARLNRQFAALDQAIAALKAGLGATWQRTAIIVATEFGRTAAVNGTRGTDHGTAGAAFLFGGAVDGGRVIADWPGLGGAMLYEGRDLMPTLDLRAILKGVMADHMKVAGPKLDLDIFPDSGTVKPLSSLIRA